jgi:uncharacterized metal-binding protein YceD (DUF177 family)
MSKNQFIIKFAGLPVGSHEFEFGIKGKFFEQYTECEIEGADLKAVVTLLKQNTLMQLKLELQGTVILPCDRCLKAGAFPIDVDQELVVKYGDPDESNDELMVISEGEGQADISHYLYEFVMLALPLKRIPCEVNEGFVCDEKTLKRLNENISHEEQDNPQWEKLNQLKKYNKN